MDRFRVLICGGGIAAVEALLRLRRLTAEGLDITLLTPAEELRIRPLAVQEPFSRPGPRRYPLRRIAQRTSSTWVEDALEWIDPDAQTAHTSGGASLPFDALLLAVGGRTEVPYEHVTAFDDAHADDTYRGLVQDVEEGYTRSIALLLPPGPTWPLPVYELALMTAERARSMGLEGLPIDLITPEKTPLQAFGAAASEAVAELLGQSGVTVHPSSEAAVPASRRLIIHPSGQELERERIVAMPRVVGRTIRGVPSDPDGFFPVDRHCRVQGLEPRVFAAGDAANYPIKHGGLGAQMADTAAAGIAALAGANVDVAPLRPVIHGVLYTGGQPLYLTTRLDDAGGAESEVTREEGWPAGEKVVAEELGPFLESLD